MWSLDHSISMAVNYKNARLLALAMSALGIFCGVSLFVMSVTFVSYPNFVEEYISIYKVKIVCVIAIVLSLVLAAASAANLVATLKVSHTVMQHKMVNTEKIDINMIVSILNLSDLHLQT